MPRVLAGLSCALLLSTPTLAGAAQAMPPNQPRLMEALRDRGVIPADATPEEALAIYQDYVVRKVGGGEDRPNPVAAEFLEAGEKQRAPVNHHGRVVRPNNARFDNVLTLLVEFAGSDTDAAGVTHVGPLHNEIAESDNGSFWVEDFDNDHYETMLFDRTPGAKTMSNYYLEQSGGRYTVDGEVYGWIQLPHSEWWYGADTAAGHDRLNGPVWRVVADAAAVACDVPWAEFDTEDPYDLDGDGVFSEPDGYVDHLQIVHAGEGQEAGGGAQGEDAIWAHSWWVNGAGTLGPLGGTPTCDPNVWVGPYTINPEDGTIGVFVHEFGHDLGLPDLYDTQYSGQASTASWTLMANGSWIACPGEAAGTCPSSMGAWEKWVLGWLDPVIVRYGESAEVELRRATAAGPAGKAVLVELPDYPYVEKVNDPHSGEWEWYSGQGNELDNTLTRPFDVPVDGAVLSYWTWFEIETDWDYGYVEVSTDNGATWTTVPGNLTTSTDPHGNNAEGNGITGFSGGWLEASHDLGPWAGESILLRFRYETDLYTVEAGWAVDDVAIAAVGFNDDAESGNTGWVADGWSLFEGGVPGTASHYYVLEWRTQEGFDVGMTAWSNRGITTVEAQPGLLLWYRNGRYTDNWVGFHPWAGRLLLVDARPELVVADGLEWLAGAFTAIPGLPPPFQTDMQLVDAAFGVQAVPPQELTGWYWSDYESTAVLPGGAGVPEFDDTRAWYDPTFAPWFWLGPNAAFLREAISSVATPTYGLKVRVTKQRPKSGKISIDWE